MLQRNIFTESPKQRHKKSQQLVNKKHKTQSNYEILGINPNASQKQIKSAYFSLSKTCHPDVNQSSEAEVQFREITDAYEVLTNKESKREYDSKIGNHFTQQKNIKNADINQENLNNYRPFGKDYNNFSENQDYLNHKWKKRRTIRTENIYKRNESERKRVYDDPLNYEPKDYFKDHFNEEMMRQYSEQIDKKMKEAQELIEKDTIANIRSSLIVVFILLIPITLHFIDTLFNMNDSKSKATQTDCQSNTKSKT